MTALATIFWIALGLLIYAQFGYPLLLRALVAVMRRAAPVRGTELPSVAFVIAAHNEQGVIERKIHNVLELDYPRELLEVIVASDGSTDDTPERARAAGADLVLELPRGGKIRAQDAAVRETAAELVAFSDANSLWRASALRELVTPFADPKVGYVCGQVRFTNEHGSNQEGLYWRYELWLRALESRLSSITAGNGAIYATRRKSYIEVDPVMGHDLSFPFNMVKRGWRAVYEPRARASEKMVPSIEGELRRKRRMMSHTWPILLRGGLLSPKGYGPLYGLEIFSHRLLRYASPFLHLLALATNTALVGAGTIYVVTLTLQLAVLAAALLAAVVRVRPLLIARYYVLTTASIALGLYDWLRHKTTPHWEAADGTR